MRMRTFEIAVLFCLFLFGGLVSAQNLSPPTQGEEASPKYGYYYKGRLISLHASERLIAIEETAVPVNTFAEGSDLERDPLSDRVALKKRNLGLYRLKAGKTKGESKTADQVSIYAQTRSFAEATGRVFQPVFEQGQALLISSDEVIVGFKEDTSYAQAREYLDPYQDGQGVVEVREHRKNTYILKIDSPADGRVFQVCQFLSELNKVKFAEPNFIVVMLHEPNQLNKIESIPRGEMIVKSTGGPIPSGQTFSPEMSPAAPTWTTIASLDFESTTFPPAGWQIGVLDKESKEESAAYWGRTNYRSHNGSNSVYCAASGSAAVQPPGPAPINMEAVLRSPTYDLTSYEEVYVEVWFYAKNDLYEIAGYLFFLDQAQLLVFNKDSGQGTGLNLVIPHSEGDCTIDPTTANGWRKLLFRVPPDYRVQNVFFEFRYTSSSTRQFEGAYLDDIRIVGTTDVDTEPLGNDTYSARLYEFKNVGQIAGLGNDSNDMQIPEAWDLISVSPEVVVAVIDEGVDLTHPDLNLKTGYDSDGSVGGAPKDTHWEENHGTSVAGNIGAKRNNSIGVIGTAPGVKIMPIHYGYTSAEFSNAIDVAVQHEADVLNNSWGWVGAPSTDIENAIKDALAAGRVVLFAAGNGPDRDPYTYETAFPCNLTESTDLICVGATSPTDEHKAAASSDGLHGWGSSYVGPGPDVCAPGPWSYTTDRQGADGYNDGTELEDPDYTHDFGGTSSATPKVAGIVALMLSAKPDMTPAEVKSRLRNTADDIDEPGIDDKTGAGRVNAYRALYDLQPSPAPLVTTGGASAVSSTSATLHGTVNPNGSSTTYYFQYGTTTSYGSTSTQRDAGSGSDDVQVSVEIPISDPIATYHYRLVATNAGGTSYGEDKTFTNDTDSDSMADDWEIAYFGDLSHDGTHDTDDDDFTDLQEYRGGTDPTDPNSHPVRSMPWLIVLLDDEVKTPNAPSNLQATAVDSTSISLSWNDNSTDEDGFKIYRGTSEQNINTLVATVGKNVTNHTDTGRSPNTAYYYRVKAYNSAGESNASNIASATTPTEVTGPNKPTNLQATAVSNKRISLSWNDNSTDEDGFKIYRGTSEQNINTLVDTVAENVEDYTDTGLPTDTTYYYRVKAYNSAGESDPSNMASATLRNAPVLTGPSTASGGEFTITWTYDWPFLAGSNDHNEVQYAVSPNSSVFSLLNKYDQRATIFNLTIEYTGFVGKTLYFRVRTNALGYYSDWSNVIAVYIAS